MINNRIAWAKLLPMALAAYCPFADRGTVKTTWTYVCHATKDGQDHESILICINDVDISLSDFYQQNLDNNLRAGTSTIGYPAIPYYPRRRPRAGGLNGPRRGVLVFPLIRVAFCI